MSELLAVKDQINIRERADILLKAALSKKAQNPVLLNLVGISSLADYFLIVSGVTERQVTAIAEAILMTAKEAKIQRRSKEGVAQGTWALLDFGDIIVHVFKKETREFYDLEGLWIEAAREKFSDDIKQEIQDAAAIEDEWDDFE
jgi:ribosome-associated protein